MTEYVLRLHGAQLPPLPVLSRTLGPRFPEPSPIGQWQGAKSVKRLSWGRREMKVGRAGKGGESVGQRHGENAHKK